MEIVNVSALAILGIFDYVKYKIPNVILSGWFVTIIVYKILEKGQSTLNNSIEESFIASLLVAGSFLPLKHIVKCNAGDFKLCAVLTVAEGLNNTLWILFISIMFSIPALASGIKKIQVAIYMFFGYIAFIFLRKVGVI